MRSLAWMPRQRRHQCRHMLLMLAVAGADAMAAETVVDEAMPEQPSPVAFDTSHDWIQLTSGEWLKGRFQSMRKNEVLFDSDKLDQLSLKWKDIRAVYTARPMAVMRNDNSIVVGRIESVNGRLIIGDHKNVGHDDIISIATSTDHELDRWFGDINIGANLRKGNVEQKELTVDMAVTRRTAKSTLALSYLANYSEFDSEENANDQRFSVAYDYRLTPDWFVRPVQGEYFRDPFQNISSRVTVGPGVGYFFINEPDLSWYTVVGPAYQHTHFVETPPDENETSSTAAGFFTVRYDQEVTSYLDVLFQYELIVSDEESGHLAHHIVASLDIDLTSSLDLTVSTYWDHIDNPQTRDDGTEPKRDDMRFVVGLELEI